MATLILELSKNLHEELTFSAARHRRSIEREAIACLERALGSSSMDVGETLARARQTRERAGQVYVTDDALRSARDDRRA
ncbi:MAG TPA: hypothetical protein VF584_12530 [Longimicrobium sp.]|jgi:plasmid stability protein